MFRKNNKHQQPALISAASELPEKQRKRLENSWAGTFYKEFFCRVDEQAFAVLYSEKASRPNVPVNVLAGRASAIRVCWRSIHPVSCASFIQRCQFDHSAERTMT